MMARWISILVLAVECYGASGAPRHKPPSLRLFQVRKKASAPIPSTNPLGRSPETVASGRLLYNGSCTVCHGLEGTAGDRAPALAAARRYVRSSDDAIFDAIKNGIPGRPIPAADLPDGDGRRFVADIGSLGARGSEEKEEGILK